MEKPHIVALMMEHAKRRTFLLDIEGYLKSLVLCATRNPAARGQEGKKRRERSLSPGAPVILSGNPLLSSPPHAALLARPHLLLPLYPKPNLRLGSLRFIGNANRPKWREIARGSGSFSDMHSGIPLLALRGGGVLTSTSRCLRRAPRRHRSTGRVEAMRTRSILILGRVGRGRLDGLPHIASRIERETGVR
ncbi:hypothetical protein HPP92_024607 [Vanilla planifolia]|uniref:Uncharacterized protein n=1 Tax=Vanilla planifolia TaxID=51239 RepID=A0A835UBH3_VANPL|nr:hypothetical protein HPP92_024607 [Vanilla planifolia]